MHSSRALSKCAMSSCEIASLALTLPTALALQLVKLRAVACRRSISGGMGPGHERNPKSWSFYRGTRPCATSGPRNGICDAS